MKTIKSNIFSIEINRISKLSTRKFMYNWYINTLWNHQYSYWAATTHTSNYCDDYVLFFILIGKSRWNMRCWSQPFLVEHKFALSYFNCKYFAIKWQSQSQKTFCLLGAQTESWEKQGMRWVDTFHLKYHRPFIQFELITSNIFTLKCLVTTFVWSWPMVRNVFMTISSCCCNCA